MLPELVPVAGFQIRAAEECGGLRAGRHHRAPAVAGRQAGEVDEGRVLVGGQGRHPRRSRFRKWLR